MGKSLEQIEAALKSNTDECILFEGCKSAKGYGLVTGTTAHRKVLQRLTGMEGKGLHAAHMPGVCHNPACINPRHLRWATPSENERDKFIDGTANVYNTQGSRHGNAKLDEEKALFIYNSPLSSRELAKQFGISPRTADSVKAKRSWKHIHTVENTAGVQCVHHRRV